MPVAIAPLRGVVDSHRAPEADDVVQEEVRRPDAPLVERVVAAVFVEVAPKQSSQHAVADPVLTEFHRLQEEQDPPGRVAIGVVLPTDLMDQVMTEGQATEGGGGPGFLPVQDAQGVADRLRHGHVLRIGLPVDQQGPVHVTLGRSSPRASDPKTTNAQSAGTRPLPPSTRSIRSRSAVVAAAASAMYRQERPTADSSWVR